MSFEKINCFNQNAQQKQIDIKKFNKDYEDSMLLSKLNTSESVTYEIPKRDGTSKRVTIDGDIIDPSLVKGRNFFDPTRDDFIDPNTDSNTRLVIMCLVDKYTKTIFVMLNKQPYRYWLPGGKPKIIEPADRAALRIFHSITGLKLDSKKIINLYNTPTTNIFFTLHFDKKLIKRTLDTAWVPLEYLRYYQNKSYEFLYKMIYIKIMNILY